MKRKQKRGFAIMDKERARAIASKGGSSVPRHKRSFFQDRHLASEAGKIGGTASRRNTERDKSTP